MTRPGLLAGLCRGSWLLLGAALFVAPPACGDDALLLGAWEGGDRATSAIYGRLLVTRAFVKWSGSRANPACRVRYRLVTRKEAEAYPDALPGFDAAPSVQMCAKQPPPLPVRVPEKLGDVEISKLVTIQFTFAKWIPEKFPLPAAKGDTVTVSEFPQIVADIRREGQELLRPDFDRPGSAKEPAKADAKEPAKE